MEPLYGLILFGVVVLGFLAILNVVQGRRRKVKAYYIAAMVGLLMLLWSVFIILNQLIFAVIFFVAWVTLTFTLLPKAGEAIMRDQLKQVEEADLSAPLRIRDFLAWKGWIKLASIYGFRKTMCLYCLFMMGVGGAIFFTLNIFGIISILWAAGCTILVGIVSIIIFYRQIGKASK